MEGQGTIEMTDRIVDNRLQVMEALNCPNLGRTMGSWYTATPPLCRCYTGLSPADYFGRMMVANLPSNIRVGIVHVAVAGCRIELFDKDNYEAYAATAPEYMTQIIGEYGGNPYGRLVEMAKRAMNDGIIKGILLHQGESNTGDSQWPSKVRTVYDNLMHDLDLNPDSVPLFAGEVVNADQGGVCSSMNAIIATLPQTLPNSYVVSSKGCTDGADNVHFNSAGYRELGKRYAVKMLLWMGRDTTGLQYPDIPETTRQDEAFYFEPECTALGHDWDIQADADASNGTYVVAGPGSAFIASAPEDSSAMMYFPFTVQAVGNFRIFARLKCPDPDEDSFWLQMDDRGFAMINGLTTTGWQWLQMNSYMLTPGDHTLTVACRESGAALDKIGISNMAVLPEGMGEAAVNICELTISKGTEEVSPVHSRYALDQNYPNPFSGSTRISFEIPHSERVSLKIFTIFGVEIAELGGRVYDPGKHELEFDAGNLPEGPYICVLMTDRFYAIRKMMVH